MCSLTSLKKEVPEDAVEAAPKCVGLTNLTVTVLSVSKVDVFKLYSMTSYYNCDVLRTEKVLVSSVANNNKNKFKSL